MQLFSDDNLRISLVSILDPTSPAKNLEVISVISIGDFRNFTFPPALVILIDPTDTYILTCFSR